MNEEMKKVCPDIPGQIRMFVLKGNAGGAQLQQQWTVYYEIAGGKKLGMREEWRDVPWVQEETK
jgi:hypothetical protein